MKNVKCLNLKFESDEREYLHIKITITFLKAYYLKRATHFSNLSIKS